MPVVFHALAARGHHIRRSEFTMIAGQPEAGKSLIALWHAIQWVTAHGMRGIYFSADSAELGQAARALSMKVMNLSSRDAEAMLEVRDTWAIDQMRGLNNLSWSFEDDLSYENIDEEVQAFVELWGTTPDFIIVDNLTDVDGQSEDEFGTLRRATKALTQLARHTDSAVIGLHHTPEDPKYDGNPCPPRNAIFGKATSKPALIYTVSNKGDKRPMAAVKDRFARADKTGQTADWFWLDEQTLHFREA